MLRFGGVLAKNVLTPSRLASVVDPILGHCDISNIGAVNYQKRLFTGLGGDDDNNWNNNQKNHNRRKYDRSKRGINHDHNFVFLFYFKFCILVFAVGFFISFFVVRYNICLFVYLFI